MAGVGHGHPSEGEGKASGPASRGDKWSALPNLERLTLVAHHVESRLVGLTCGCGCEQMETGGLLVVKFL